MADSNVSPISRVPAELIVCFVEEDVTPTLGDDVESALTRIRLLLLYTAICRYWRSVLHSTRRLWAANVNTLLPPSVFDLVKIRSGDSNPSLFLLPHPEDASPGNPQSSLRNFNVSSRWISRCERLHLTLPPNLDIATHGRLIQELNQFAYNILSLTIDLKSSKPSRYYTHNMNLLRPSTDSTPIPLRHLHLRGTIAHNPSLSVATRPTDLRTLVLQGYAEVTPATNPHASSHLFTPRSLLDFIRPMSTLRVLVLDQIIQWSEPMSEEFISAPTSFKNAVLYSSVPPATVNLPHLKYLELNGDFFTVWRFIGGLGPLPPCRTKVWGMASNNTRWNENTFRSAISAYLQLVPTCEGVEGWTLSFGEMFMVRVEKGYSVVFDLRFDLHFLGPNRLSAIYSAFSDVVPGLASQWDFSHARILRIYSGQGLDTLVDDTEMLFGDEIFQRCGLVEELHLHGMSAAVFNALCGSSLDGPPFTVRHSLPKLTKVFVVMTSFISASEGSKWEYLSNAFAARGDKRLFVSQIQKLVVVNNRRRPPEYPLETSVLPFLSLEHPSCQNLSVSLISAADYNTVDPGVVEGCRSCKRFGAWYNDITQDWFIVSFGENVPSKCECFKHFL